MNTRNIDVTIQAVLPVEVARQLIDLAYRFDMSTSELIALALDDFVREADLTERFSKLRGLFDAQGDFSLDPIELLEMWRDISPE